MRERIWRDRSSGYGGGYGGGGGRPASAGPWDQTPLPPPRAPRPSRRCRAFTLTELLVVIGLILVMMSLLMPALGKVRAAASATSCLSNLRQMGIAWTLYTGENKGRLLEYIWATGPRPDIAWRGYWPGVLEEYKVRGDVLLCPSASEPVPFSQNKGFGTVWQAWTGKYSNNGTPVRFSASLYRDGSYGYNRYMTAGGGFALDARATKLTSIRPLSDVPIFMDAVYADFQPLNGSETSPVQPPPDLRGSDLLAANNDHWRFLIARHGRGVNVCMADGSARRVPLEEMYELTWKAGWIKYRLSLPAF
jgi:prepilin-type processing-associated H-X9-DG protein/prepilin-type N-terminal cleavage/methylation domain-containing protein